MSDRDSEAVSSGDEGASGQPAADDQVAGADDARRALRARRHAALLLVHRIERDGMGSEVAFTDVIAEPFTAEQDSGGRAPVLLSPEDRCRSLSGVVVAMMDLLDEWGLLREPLAGPLRSEVASLTMSLVDDVD